MGSNFTRTVVWLFAILGAVGLLLYLFVFDMWEVPGTDLSFISSVAPTLAPQDRILTSRNSVARFGELSRCLRPMSSDFVIGRVFGVGGDTVKIDNERVSVNKLSPKVRFGCGTVTVLQPVSQEQVALSCAVEDNGAFTYSTLTHPEFREGQTNVLVEPGKAFLVSDDRHFHNDSRDYGQVDASTCQHVVFRLWGERFTDGSRRFTILW